MNGKSNCSGIHSSLNRATLTTRRLEIRCSIQLSYRGAHCTSTAEYGVPASPGREVGCSVHAVQDVKSVIQLDDIADELTGFRGENRLLERRDQIAVRHRTDPPEEIRG